MAGTTKGKVQKSFTDEERAAMKEYAAELRSDKSNGEDAVMEKIAAMPEPDRSLAKRVHTIVRTHAPTLIPKTWYGMPAYATRDGKVVCFFQNASKFKARYATLGFGDVSRLDDGTLWPVAYALTKITPETETKIAALVKKAAG